MTYIHFHCMGDAAKDQLIPIDKPMTTPCINNVFYLYIGGTPYLKFRNPSEVRAFWNDFVRQTLNGGIFTITAPELEKGANNGVCNF